MKKIVKSSLFVLAAVAVSVACSKEMSPVIPGNQVTITAYIPDELTKVSFTPDANLDGPVKIAWEDLDKIRVIDHNDAADNSQFAIQPGFTAHQASFSGTAVEATSYDILYPGTMESVAEAEAFQFGIQTQTNNANAAQLAYMALLSNVNTYESVEFSEAWATAHGGSFKQTGILRLRIQLPDGFTDDVASVTVNAPSAIFYKSNALVSGEKVSSLKLNFTGAGATPDAGVITGYVMLPWENVTIAANTTLSVIVETADHKFYTKSFTPSTTEDVVLTMGRVNAIKINKTGFGAASTTFAGGSGTAADPWLIANKAHMENIVGKLSAGVTTYFKLIDDIDMTGVEWTPVVTASPWNRHIDFDGNNKSINNLSCTSGNYASLFGVFSGNARNFTVKNATITPPSGQRVGVIAGLVGTKDMGTTAFFSNITLDNCNVGSSLSRATTAAGIFVGETRINTNMRGIIIKDGSVYGNSNAGTGGLIGAIAYTSLTTPILACKSSGIVNTTGSYAGGIVGVARGTFSVVQSNASGNVTGDNYVGGLIGNANTDAANVSVSECYYKSGTVNANKNGGGLVGYKSGASYKITISNCYVSGTVTATTGYIGGLLGVYYEGSGADISNSFVSGGVTVTNGCIAGGLIGWVRIAGLNMTKCLAWNSSVSATIDNSDEQYSSGAIIGYANDVNVTISNSYRKKGFSFTDCTGNSANILTDGGNISNSKISGTAKIRPYHGRKETPMTTVSAFALNSGIKWDTDIWDTNTETPTLINNPE